MTVASTSIALKNFDRVADSYDATRGFPPYVEERVIGGIAALLKELGAEPHVIEVGVGTGRIAAPLAAHGIKVTGTDISTGMLSKLDSKGAGVEPVKAEASQPPFKAKSFDAALFVHILHLVPDAEATIRSTMKLVREGGMVLRGSTENEEPLEREAHGIIRAIATEIGGEEAARRTRDQETIGVFNDVVDEAGAWMEVVELDRWYEPVTGQAILDQWAEQSPSSTWNVSAEHIPAVIERARPAVEKLFGTLDRTLDARRSFTLMVARLP
ncbi:MAG TPA: class I SAM-dependent methyltransferase [Tepidiformaceae bacterium]|nr:class I SAM-dependent methyltransferase [Tepidiformaceae bacterium]